MTPERLRAAAAALRENATVLRESCALDGEWDLTDLASVHAKEDHDDWVQMATELDEHAGNVAKTRTLADDLDDLNAVLDEGKE